MLDRGNKNLLPACEHFHLWIGSPAEDLAYKLGSWCHWPHVFAARPRRWPGSCYCMTKWWAGGGEDACCAQTPLGDSDPCLKKERYFFFQIKIQLGTVKQGYLVGLNIHTSLKSINSPKNNACNSKGKCMIQSSLTPWSTTISVMKMTAILHL